MASALETLCGQAFGAKQLHMLSIYMQRSWMVLFLCSLVLLPCYVFATPVLKLIGEPDDVAELSGKVAVWLIPLHFSFAFNFPLQRFLQSQLKPGIMAWASLAVFLIHIFLSWFLVYVIRLGIAGLVIALDVAYWLQPLFQLAYVLFGGCPDTWNGFSWEAFSGLWDFVKLSAASGVMLCLENWYYRILVIMTGDLKNAAIAVDALSVCMTINGWEMMIPLAFFAATGVRVSNELGAGNGKAAKFATKIAVATSTVIGLFFCAIIMIFHNKFALIFTSSDAVLEAVNSLAWLLAVAILLNSIQPVLSGVAVGSGWQAWVAYINLGCYYIVGLPLGIIMGWVFHTGVQGIWAGMIFGGTGLQTLVLSMVVARCDWDKEAEKATKHVQRWAN
ncbi:Protein DETOXIFICATION 27 [Dionaea muscipula]